MEQDPRFDNLLMSILQQKGKIDGFFDIVYGFLRRNTDFFSDQKKAEEIIVNTCKANYERYNKQHKDKVEAERKRKEEAEMKKAAKEKEAAVAQKPVKPQTTATQSAPPTDSTVAPPAAKKDDEKDQPAPKGNGGRTDQYIWIQTLQNLEIFVFLAPDTVKKTVKVDFNIEKLDIKVSGNVLLSGKWKSKINSDKTFWTIEDGAIDGYNGMYIHIDVEKWKNQNSWWSAPLQGQPEINTQKINPEPSKLSDLDGETKGTVGKMMFDMQQKQKGLPTSDELEKQDKMKEFMKAHPELDFSQCKFG